MKTFQMLQKQEWLARAEVAADYALVQCWGATSALQTSLPPGLISVSGDQRLTALWQFSQSNHTVFAQITALEKLNC
ncbi:MAG: hypothetical protein RLZZ573_2400 [Pseudomonadota bacterium]